MRRAGADVEVARAVVLERRQRRMLAEDVGRRRSRRRPRRWPRRRATCAQDPPILARLAGRRQERPLARDAALGVGDGAVLLRPGERRQADAAGIDGVAGADRLGDDGELARSQRGAHRIGVGQAGDRIGRHDPDRLDLAAADRLEQIDRLQAGLAWRCAARFQKRRDAIDVGRREIHVRGQRVGRARRPRGRPSRWAGR